MRWTLACPRADHRDPQPEFAGRPLGRTRTRCQKYLLLESSAGFSPPSTRRLPETLISDVLKLTAWRNTWASKKGCGEQPGGIKYLRQQYHFGRPRPPCISSDNRLLAGEMIDDAKLFNTKLHEWERVYNFRPPAR